MNRRSFLLALGLVACGGAARPAQRRRIAKPASAPDDPIVDFWPPSMQNMDNPLAFHGDRLAQITGKELRLWNADTMMLAGSLPIEPTAVCFVDDGTLVALSASRADEPTWVYRVDPTGHLDTLSSHVRTPPFSTLLAGRSSYELYLADTRELRVLHIARGQVREDLAMASELRFGEANQAFRRADGRVVAIGEDGAIAVVEIGKPAALYPMPGRAPVHLAPATGARIWYSYASTSPRFMTNTLALAQATTPMLVEYSAAFAPRRLIHMSSNGSAVAVLVVGDGRSPDNVVVIDDNGSERWRVEVPAAFDPIGVELANSFVAISEHRVVLARPDGALLAWDAATGAPVVVRA